MYDFWALPLKTPPQGMAQCSDTVPAIWVILAHHFLTVSDNKDLRLPSSAAYLVIHSDLWDTALLKIPLLFKSYPLNITIKHRH